MAAAVASGRQLGSSHKKRSFMNLRRDKSSESNLEKSGASKTNNRNSSYFEAYPGRERPAHQRRLSQSRTYETEEDTVVPFPSVLGRNEDIQKTPRSRRRPSTAPSPDTDQAQLPPLRFSGSSAISHSPPHTPTSSIPDDSELSMSLSSLMPVRLMAAPVVETTAMDALVDGMNGGEEDMFASVEALRGLPGGAGAPRRRRKSSAAKGFHHPLYHPPLPTPPPGIKLGVVPTPSPDSDAEDDLSGEDSTVRLPRPKPRPSLPLRGSSTGTITQDKVPKRKESLPKTPSLTFTPSRDPYSYSSSPGSAAKPSPSSSSTETPIASTIDEAVRRYVTSQDTPPRPVVPSIHEIIQTHAPNYMKTKGHRPGLSVSSPGAPSPVAERPERRSLDNTSISRSSMDSVAEEIQQTLKVAMKHPATVLQQARSFSSQPEERDHHNMSESGHGSPSISSFGTAVTAPPSPMRMDSNHALATFLRSPRLTRLLKLRRHPHQRLQVSFSDLGSSTGKPVVVFLGLGAVRYIMGLYDEMAEALGLRLITIDRWGLGKTDTPGRNVPRGVKEWASAVEEVLDYLNIDRFSLLAHSAGAPYAMALANRAPQRVIGDLCLLAPWVGAGEGTSGYKWLKYVPTGLIKTAQAAEWKVQAWMLGKPPSFNTGIGYTPQKQVNEASGSLSFSESRKSREASRPSLGSFSDYDDLADFGGHYGSRSTIHVEEPSTSSSGTADSSPTSRKRTPSKSSRLFGGLWKNGESSKSSPPAKNPKLKSLKSMTSLKGKDGKASTLPAKSGRSQTGSLPDDIEDDWSALSVSVSSPRNSCAPLPEGARGHSRARRSISLSSRPSVRSQVSRTPSERTNRRMSSPPGSELGSAFEASPGPSNAALGNALLAASHNEAQRGTHADLLVILNHNQKPWGFSYEDFPLSVKVWYGDKDEKIAEAAMRWLERTMRPGTCDLTIIKGVGHGLLYNGSVVVEALEYLKENWT